VTSLIDTRAEYLKDREKADKVVQIISNATQRGEREAFLTELRHAENQLRQRSDEVIVDIRRNQLNNLSISINMCLIEITWNGK